MTRNSRLLNRPSTLEAAAKRDLWEFTSPGRDLGDPPAAEIKSVMVKSAPDGADISVNRQFIGNPSAPCAL